EALELLVPAVLLGVEGAVPLDHPPVVARPRGAQEVRAAPARPGRLRLAQEPLDGRHGPGEPCLIGHCQPRQLRPDVFAGTCVQRREDGPPPPREPELAPPSVVGRYAPLDPPPALDRAAD